MGVRVGIPRTLWYFTYAPFWETFFHELGAESVVSPATTKEILDRGIASSVSEACVPIKLYFGHVAVLIEKWRAGEVDVIFVPRCVSWERNTIFCPKFLGLPDMVRHGGWDEVPPVISPRIDVRRGSFPLLRACSEVRRALGAPSSKLLPAYRRACRALRAHRQRLRKNWDAPDSIAAHTRTTNCKPPTSAHADKESEPPLRLALLGYPYLVYDEYVSLGILPKLRSLGVEVVMAEALAAKAGPVKHWTKSMFWTYSDMVARAGVHALNAPDAVDGVIHVTAFSCGPDAMVNKLLEIEAQSPRAKPFLTIGLDEQTGEAGCQTRLEAFVDMLQRKRRLQAAS